MVQIAELILYGLLCYVLGSIPFGVIIGKFWKGIDIREHGSGNIGTANAFRALGPAAGSVVFLGDVLKGCAAVFLAGVVFSGDPIENTAKVIFGFLSIIGHNYSLFLKFKGGKGIATSFGVFLILSWKASLIGLSIWAIVVAATKFSSLGSLCGSLSLPISMGLMKEPVQFVIFGLLACGFAFYKHRGNIKRLLAGKELKITEKPESKKKQEEES